MHNDPATILYRCRRPRRRGRRRRRCSWRRRACSSCATSLHRSPRSWRQVRSLSLPFSSCGRSLMCVCLIYTPAASGRSGGPGHCELGHQCHTSGITLELQCAAGCRMDRPKHSARSSSNVECSSSGKVDTLLSALLIRTCRGSEMQNSCSDVCSGPGCHAKPGGRAGR